MILSSRDIERAKVYGKGRRRMVCWILQMGVWIESQIPLQGILLERANFYGIVIYLHLINIDLLEQNIIFYNIEEDIAHSMNPNTYYNNFLLEFSKDNLSTLTLPNTQSEKLRKISSILDMKFFPTCSIEPQSFLSRATSEISNTKKQIMVLLNSSSHVQFQSITEKVCQTLKKLSGDPIQILETKAVRCYQNIVEIEQLHIEIKNNRQFKTLKRILQQLVRFSIIYQQYKRRQNPIKSETDIELRSESSISDSSQQPQQEVSIDEEQLEIIALEQDRIDEKLIKSIEIEIFKKEFYDVVLEYLNTERSNLKKIQQICRICQKKVLIEQMGVHLQNCQRRHYHLQQLEINKNKLLKLRKVILDMQIQEENLVYQQIADKIDQIANNNQQIFNKTCLTIDNISEIISDLQQQEKQTDTIIAFKRLINERYALLQKLMSIDFSLKQQQSGILGVDSIIKQSKLKTTASADLQKRQISWIKQCSTISYEKSYAGERKSRVVFNQSNTHQHKQTHRKHADIPKLKSKKSVRWQQKAINTKKSFNNFELLKFLGKGAFGKVYLVKDKLTHDQYAVKCIKMDKNLFQDEKNIQNLKNQHDIFRKISGQFLVKAAFSFSEGSMHMFFLQYMPGGDFAALLDQEGCLDQDVAKFYLAEIVLAIEHLHNLNIIHRDLKPANLVFDEKGHLKLTDFGLSKEGITKKLLITKQQSSSEVKQEQQPQSTLEIKRQFSLKSTFNKRKTLIKKSQKQSSSKSIVGTPDYIAPQVLNGVSTENTSIDWWSFGVIVYQTLIGVRPFGSTTIPKVYQNIRKMNIIWPPTGQGDQCISFEARDLIESLLTVNYTKRLGAEDINDIKNHPFFEGVCWQKLKSQTPPLPPRISANASQKDKLELKNKLWEQINEVESNVGQKIQLDDYMRIDLLSQKTQDAFKQITLKKKKLSLFYRQCVEKVESMKDVPY